MLRYVTFYEREDRMFELCDDSVITVRYLPNHYFGTFVDLSLGRKESGFCENRGKTKEDKP